MRQVRKEINVVFRLDRHGRDVGTDGDRNGRRQKERERRERKREREALKTAVHTIMCLKRHTFMYT